MTKQIKGYIVYIQNLLNSDSPDTDWAEICKQHLIKISFYQHERLIHLIVTVCMAIMEIISISAYFAGSSPFFLLLSGMFLILLIPYIIHYYFLENSIQKLYLIYDEIQGRIARLT